MRLNFQDGQALYLLIYFISWFIVLFTQIKFGKTWSYNTYSIHADIVEAVNKFNFLDSSAVSTNRHLFLREI